jgi:hypothetical protein
MAVLGGVWEPIVGPLSPERREVKRAVAAPERQRSRSAAATFMTGHSGKPFTAAPIANSAAIVLLYEKCMTKLGRSESVFARTVDKVNPTQRINPIPIQLPQSWLT